MVDELLLVVYVKIVNMQFDNEFFDYCCMLYDEVLKNDQYIIKKTPRDFNQSLNSTFVPFFQELHKTSIKKYHQCLDQHATHSVSLGISHLFDKILQSWDLKSSKIYDSTCQIFSWIL